MILFHGGSWQSGEAYVTSTRWWAQQLATSGFTVWNVDYSNGAGSVGDAMRWYEFAYGLADGKPVCVAGQSAGAHLALMVAGAYPTVSCVIAEAAPVDLEALDPLMRAEAGQIFGEANLAVMSPINNLAAPATDVLLAASDNDPVVPSDQAAAYKRTSPENTTVMSMPPGNEAWFVHAYTTVDAFGRLLATEKETLRRAAGVTAGAPPATVTSGREIRETVKALNVGLPIKSKRKGIARIPVEVGVSGLLKLSGRGVFSRMKTVDAGQPARLRVRPNARFKRVLRREGKVTTLVEVRLFVGPSAVATEMVEIKLRRR